MKISNGHILVDMTKGALMYQEVQVPEPESRDIWNNEFNGVIVDIHDGLATVKDQEDNAFDVETERLTLVD